MIAYCTGRFFDQGQEVQFTSETYMAFLIRVLAQVIRSIMLIQDGGKYHTSGAMQHFLVQHAERLMVFQLPSCSPDYHPIKTLWKKGKKEGAHWQCFSTFEPLTDKVEHVLP